MIVKLAVKATFMYKIFQNHHKLNIEKPHIRKATFCPQHLNECWIEFICTFFPLCFLHKSVYEHLQYPKLIYNP